VSDPDGQSTFARCLSGSGDAACFAVGATAPVLTFGSGAILEGGSRIRPGAAAAADVTPDPPTNLTSSVFRSAGGSQQVFLSWRAPASGPAPTNYRIEAGSAAGLSDLAAFNTANNSTFFSTTVSGAGTFYVRVLAVAAGGTSV